MKILPIVAIVLIIPIVGLAETVTVRDAAGKIQEKRITDGSVVRVYNAAGKLVRVERARGQVTEVRQASGKLVEKRKQAGNQGSIVQ